MTPLQTNKPVFFDGDTPLNGTIFVGQPGADPRTNPKTVTLEDTGGSQFTAKQPLDVADGKVTYNGKPIAALVDGSYSALLFDIGGRQVDYIKSFDPSGGGTGGAGDFSEVIRVGLTLDDIKAFDVSVGEVVRNVGKATAVDTLGADWLVISSTGSPGDDISLIDFTNGLQGQRYQVYPTYQEEVITLNGEFDPGDTVTVTRMGNMVTITGSGTLTYTGATSSADSAAGVIPTWARPSDLVGNVYQVSLSTNPVAYNCKVNPSGLFFITSTRTDVGNTPEAVNNSNATPTLSYVIT